MRHQIQHKSFIYFKVRIHQTVSKEEQHYSAIQLDEWIQKLDVPHVHLGIKRNIYQSINIF